MGPDASLILKGLRQITCYFQLSVMSGQFPALEGIETTSLAQKKAAPSFQ